MFNSKLKQLIGNTQTTSVDTNTFLKQGYKQSAKTKSFGNGAVKFITTGNDFVDQFGKVSQYKAQRPFQEISKDTQLLWSQNKFMALCFIFYIRIITRKVTLSDGKCTKTTQRGQGLKHEGIFRMMWVALNDPEVFWKNIPLFISIGSWKDIIAMLSYDLQYNGWKNRVLDWDSFGKLILAGLENSNTTNLVKKYLPQIKANKQCKTLEAQADNIIAKWLCSLLFGAKENQYGFYKQYRKMKVSGTAHKWQQLISRGQHNLIDFNTVHGRALAQLVSGKYLKNQHLEEVYEKWIMNKPVAKYTGYVYELLSPVKNGYDNVNLKRYQKETINKQFYGLIETAKQGMLPNDSGLMVVVDTSSSMTSNIPGTKMSSYDVAKSMALYFSYLLKGVFSKSWMEFNDSAVLKKWAGDNPVDNLQNDNSEAYGSTNFQSVTKLFVSLFKKGVPISDFPKGILCLSDGCFNHAGENKTNRENMLKVFEKEGFPKDYINNFKIILWDIPNSYYGTPQTTFEEFADAPNLFHISGFDGSAVAFITGVEAQKYEPKTNEELFAAAMNQEIMGLLSV